MMCKQCHIPLSIRIPHKSLNSPAYVYSNKLNESHTPSSIEISYESQINVIYRQVYENHRGPLILRLMHTHPDTPVKLRMRLEIFLLFSLSTENSI